MRWNAAYGMWFEQIAPRRAGGALRAVLTDLLDHPPRRIAKRARETREAPERATSRYWDERALT